MPNAADFRRIVLGLEGTIESSHMGHPDFRANGRIFVTLQHDPAWGGLMLTPEQQRRLLDDYPETFKPAAGAWGLAGATLVHLPSVSEEVLGEAVTMAWQNNANKHGSRTSRTRTSRTRTSRTNTSGTRGTPGTSGTAKRPKRR